MVTEVSTVTASGHRGKAAPKSLLVVFMKPFSMCERLIATRMIMMVGYIACEYEES